MDAFKRSLGIGTSQSSDGTRTAMDESNVARSESGGRKDGKLGKGKAKNQISQKYAQDLLQMAPDLCYYGPIMIGDHWGSLE